MPGILSRTAVRAASTSSVGHTTKAAGDISSVFPSLQPGYKPVPLPPKFKDLKRHLFFQNPEALTASWRRLLESLERETNEIKTKGSDV